MGTKENRTLGFTIVSDNNAGMRYDRWSGESYVEVLDVSGANTDRLKTFFQDHVRTSESAVGRVHDVRTERGELKANVTIGSDADSILNKYKESILTDVSIGYAIRDFEVEEKDGEPDRVTVTDYDIFELSSVGIAFDRGAVLETGAARNSELTDKQIRELNEKLDNIARKLKG